MLARFGRWCFSNRGKVLVAWVIGMVAVFGIGGSVGSAFDSSFEIPDSESRDGFDTFDTYFGGLGSGQSGSIVFSAEQGVDDPEIRSAMQTLFERADEIDGVSIASPYDEFARATQISPDGRVAFATVNLRSDIDFTESGLIGTDIANMAPEIDGLRVEIGGQALAEFEPPESELIGLSARCWLWVYPLASPSRVSAPALA